MTSVTHTFCVHQHNLCLDLTYSTHKDTHTYTPTQKAAEILWEQQRLTPRRSGVFEQSTLILVLLNASVVSKDINTSNIRCYKVINNENSVDTHDWWRQSRPHNEKWIAPRNTAMWYKYHPTEMCHPVIQKWCMNAVPADSRVNHLLLEMTGRQTKQIM